MKTKRIGLMGGTFNPVHQQHLLMAEQARIQCKLDEVWFIPTNQPPHKAYRDDVTNAERLCMLKLATEDNPYFKVEAVEMEREGKSYSYDTVKLLTKRYPNDSFYFIIGGDMIEYLPKWYKIDELVNMVQFIGVERAGYEVASPYNILQIEAPVSALSSTYVREQCAKRRSIRYLVPSKVATYIEERGLYHGLSKRMD